MQQAYCIAEELIPMRIHKLWLHLENIKEVVYDITFKEGIQGAELGCKERRARGKALCRLKV